MLIIWSLIVLVSEMITILSEIVIIKSLVFVLGVFLYFHSGPYM